MTTPEDCSRCALRSSITCKNSLNVCRLLCLDLAFKSFRYVSAYPKLFAECNSPPDWGLGAARFSCACGVGPFSSSTPQFWSLMFTDLNTDHGGFLELCFLFSMNPGTSLIAALITYPLRWSERLLVMTLLLKRFQQRPIMLFVSQLLVRLAFHICKLPGQL